MNKKTLVVILAVMLLACALFGVSAGLAGRGPGGGRVFDPQAPWLERIRAWLSRPAGASALALRSGSPADCHLENERITIQAGRTCVYAVAVDKRFTRRLRLARPATQNQAGRLAITLEQRDALKIEQTPEPGKEADSLDIYGRQDQAAATLRIEGRGLPWIDPGEYVVEIVGGK